MYRHPLDAPAGNVLIQVLGPVALVHGGRSATVPRAQARAVLALLALAAGQAVTHERIVAALWGGDGPPAARSQVYGAVSSIRRLLVGTGATVDGGRFGYRLMIAPDSVDALRFERELRLARSERDSAARRLRDALALWRGEALADATGSFVEGARARLGELRLTAVDELVLLDIAAGRYGDAAASLAPVVAEHPTHERLRGRLMVALARDGRKADALRLYHEHRAWLSEHEGLDPGPELAELAESILLDRDIAEPVRPEHSVPAQPGPSAQRPSRPPPLRPAGLPGAPAGFVGRAEELRWLTESAERDQGAAAVNAVVGAGGVGKTALAVQWGRQTRSRFPDGQLYVNMHGYSSGRPVTPLDALGRFLRALDVPSDRIPSDGDEAAALYRSVLADRQVLVMLDNVRSADQARPLLPGAPGCVTLVTSRDSLDTLVAVDGARRLELDVLTPRDAIAVLSGLLGQERVRAEPAAAADLATACGYLPLALRITAAQLTARSGRPIAQHLRELRGEDRLGALALADDAAASVGATLDMSYQALPARVARLYRLLGLSPAADLDVWGLAALAGLPVADAASLARQLKAAHLVNEVINDVSPERYAQHDLVHLHAARQATHTDSDASRGEAVTRLVEWYADTAVAANQAVAPRWQPPEWERAQPPLNPLSFDSEPDAMAWLAREHGTLVCLTRHAADVGVSQAVLPLAEGQFTYLLRHHMAATMIDLNRISWDVAIGRADDAALAASAQAVGVGHSLLNQLDDAVRWYERSLECNLRMGHENRVARTHINLGAFYSDSGRLEQAVHHLRMGLGIARRIGDGYGEGHALGNLAYAYQQMRHWVLAEQTFTEAIAVQRKSGDRGGECVALGNLGQTYLEQGHHPQAATYLRAALELAEELGDQTAIARSHTSLGDLHLALGDPRRARLEWQEALRIFLDLDHPEAKGAQDRLRNSTRP